MFPLKRSVANFQLLFTFMESIGTFSQNWLHHIPTSHAIREISNQIGQKMSHLSMAIPVMVRVETKVMQAGPMPDRQHNQGALGPVHLL